MLYQIVTTQVTTPKKQMDVTDAVTKNAHQFSTHSEFYIPGIITITKNVPKSTYNCDKTSSR